VHAVTFAEILKDYIQTIEMSDAWRALKARIDEFGSFMQEFNDKYGSRIKVLVQNGEWQRIRILRVADDAIENDNHDDLDRQILEAERSEFSSSMQIIIDLPQGDPIKSAALKANNSAFLIGLMAENPKETARELIQKGTPEIKQYIGDNAAAQMRNAKAKKDAENEEALKTAIIACAKTHKCTLAISEKFAKRIRPDVRKKLGLPPERSDWPQWRTIKDTISAIKRGQD
jgi:hypothetical protein